MIGSAGREKRSLTLNLQLTFIKREQQLFLDSFGDSNILNRFGFLNGHIYVKYR